MKDVNVWLQETKVTLDTASLRVHDAGVKRRTSTMKRIVDVLECG